MSASQKVPQRKIGSQGLVASAQGLGCMGMTAFYVENPENLEEQSLQTIDKALEVGINLLDTAWIYQNKTGAKNEELVAKAIKKHGRDKFVIATKFGITYTGIDSKPETIRTQVQESLTRLGTDYIDLYYQHRVDPNVPMETVAETVKQLIAEGKVKYFGLSECTGDELKRAHAVQPVTAIQMEWSLQTRDLEKSVVPVARELGVAIVAYSPLGRGMLSLAHTKIEDFDKDDWRLKQPRFQKEAFEANIAKVKNLESIAKRKGCTVGQLALAWVHSRGEDVFPIPGTKSPSRLEENAAAALLTLTPEEQAEIEATVPEASEERYSGQMGKSTFNDRL